MFANAANSFNLFIGSNYIADSTVEGFNKQNKCTLVQNFFNDNDEMLAKIAAGANGYNAIVATSYAVEQLSRMGKIIPLDKSKLPNLKNIDPKFLNQSFDPNNKYSIPYAYNPVFLAYNQSKMKALNIPINSWAAVFDPKYLKKMNGHVTVFDSSRNVIAAALLYLNKDPNSTNRDDLKAARALIEAASPYWVKYDSDSYYRGLMRGDIWLSMAYSIDLYKTIQDMKASKMPINIGASLQKEGNMIEFDNLVIPVFSNNVDLSYKFLNYSLDAKSAYDLSMTTGSSVANIPALDKLPESVKSIDWIYPKDMSKIHVFKMYDPKTRIYVNEMWAEIKMNGNCCI